ncbi:MAG: GAF domain-containing sensor histidine kinase [Candidatus Omnitrophica bacterium]|nr:GAF domain-containing sensor histidine kinase [Candidatus Omnitrophota bacterium]
MAQKKTAPKSIDYWLKRLEGHLDAEKLILNCCKMLMEVSQADRCSIMVLDANSEELFVRWAQGIRVKPYGTARFRVGEGLCGWVAKSQKPLFSFDLLKERRFMPAGSIKKNSYKPVKAILCLPLIHHGRTVGVLNLSSFSAKPAFQTARTRLSKRFLARLAQVISQATLLNEAEANSQRWRNIIKSASDTVAQVSHEVKTPLTLLMEGAQQLLDGYGGTLTPEQKERVVLIKNQSERMLRLVTELLDFSKIEAGRMVFHRKPVYLTQIIQEVRDRYEPLINPRRLVLQLSSVPAVYGDPTRLAQVLENLLTNAVKFTPPEGIITIRLEAKGRCAELSVMDDGIGISKREQRRLFEKFFQPRTPAHVNMRGTGLGLAIIKEVVQMHGGTVRVKSEPGKGTAFLVGLPLYTPAFALTEEFRVLREQASRQGLALACQLFQADPHPLVMWQEVKELIQRHVAKEDKVLINPDGGLILLSVMDPAGLQSMRRRLEEVCRQHPELFPPASVRWGWAWVPEEGTELPLILELAKSRSKENLFLPKNLAGSHS